MSAWELIFYETPSGRRPVSDYLDGLMAFESSKVISDLELLAELGLELGAPPVPPSRGRIWELHTSAEIDLAESRFADYAAREER